MLINWWDLLLIAFALAACIQLFYYLWFFRRLANYQPEEKEITRENAVSVIVCARDEAENLANNLPGVLVQTYRSTYEVVVVNDNSKDETRYLLEGLHKQFRNLNIVELKQAFFFQVSTIAKHYFSFFSICVLHFLQPEFRCRNTICIRQQQDFIFGCFDAN